MNHRVIAVSLFDYKDSSELMKNAGVEVIEADLIDEEQLEKLPKIENIIFMVGKNSVLPTALPRRGPLTYCFPV